MFVRRLQITNWKNFRSGNVEMSRRLFLVGPNASGKSNFLDVFRFLREICLAKGGGFRQAIEQRGGVSVIRCLAARNYSDVTIEVRLKEDDSKDDASDWLYRLCFSQDKQRNPIIKEERVEHNGKLMLNRPDRGDKEDPLRLTQSALEQLNINKEFRPIVTFFQSISYQHLLPQVMRDPQGFSPHQIENDPFGRDFLQRVEGTQKNFRDSRLKKIQNVLKTVVPKLTEISVMRDGFGVPHLVGLFEHWRPNAGKQNEAQFSDGTLRLFGLLWSLFEGDGPLLMEEPELSLHTEIVCHLPQLIERINRHRKVRRQVIISTHSEEILSDKGIGATEVLRLEPSDNGTLLHLSSDNAEESLLLKSGLSVADVVLPKSAPAGVQQLPLFLR
jgi:hypothetical protein